ncbi:MAG: Spy/CpxP family protein refolding chaperone, partial [Halothiobacillaceae bacterium]|nr:Spy/CpxP family protein refolding chaperone [Halothiobacillaceae bacterium]
ALPISAAVLSLALALPVASQAADGRELSAPIVELMPHVKKMGAELKLNAEQQAKIDAWRAETPIKRKAIEDETLNMRKQLREAILSGADQAVRDDLIKQIAANEATLLGMRSKCTDMLRATLSAEQFTKLVESYKASH